MAGRYVLALAHLLDDLGRPQPALPLLVICEGGSDPRRFLLDSRADVELAAVDCPDDPNEGATSQKTGSGCSRLRRSASPVATFLR